jgi:hypothetical protein
VAAASPEQQLAWEASQRKRAAVSAVVAGVFLIAADIWINVAFRNGPEASFLESVLRLPAPGSIADEPSLRLESFEFFDSRSSASIASAALRSIGLIALAYAMTFLAVATRARRPEMARPFVYVTLFGAVLLAVEAVVRTIANLGIVQDFLDGPRTVGAIDDLGGDFIVAAELIKFVGQFAVAAGFIVVSLNAMRAGLLSRFMGILGMIVGFLLILPLAVVPVQPLWLVALGVLFWGWWPGGVPPAWRTGQAEPWPSQADVARARRDARGGEPAAETATAPAARAPAQPSSSKRKRKRRG